MDTESGKWLSSGFVLLDCPQSMKIDSSSASIVGSISDYLLSLSNGWDLTSYLRSLSKALKALKLSPSMSANPKEGSNGSCMVRPLNNFQFLFPQCILFPPCLAHLQLFVYLRYFM